MKLKELYDKLPKWVRVVPYVVASGAVLEIIKHLEAVEIDNSYAYGAIINILIVSLIPVLKGMVARLMELRK